MEFPQVAGASPPDSDLGLLQRGRGSGWLRAAGSGSGVDLFRVCVERDPSWDAQVESRTDYYASLAVCLSVPVCALLPVSRETDAEWFRLIIVEAMAERGSIDAARELAVVAGRPEAPESGITTDERAVSRRAAAPFALDAPIERLLAESRPPFRKAVLHRLRITKDSREVRVLRRASLDASSPGWRLALRVLGSRGDMTALPAAEAVLIANLPGGQRASAFAYVKALPSIFSLPLARSWLENSDGRGTVAQALLAEHAELVDAPAIRSALADATDYYSICSLVEALGRLPAAGPFPELHRVYVESAYSFARTRSVDAMAATDPEFAERWAAECLWDCEEGTRYRGAQWAPATATVRARLQELVDDIHEASDVREAARLRLD